MSLEPRNFVCDGPDVFAKLTISPSPAPNATEASPIYTSIDAQVAVSGSYVDGTKTFDFSHTTSITTLTRVAARDGSTVTIENLEIERDHNVSAYADIAAEPVPGANETIMIGRGLLSGSGLVVPFDPPNLSSSLLEEVAEIGTVTDTAPDPDTTTAIEGLLSVFAPYFTGTISGGDLKMVVRMDGLIFVSTAAEYPVSFTKEIDASAWGSPDFRDIRGTYSQTDTDSNGIEYVWSVTVG